jgi:lysozyme
MPTMNEASTIDGIGGVVGIDISHHNEVTDWSAVWQAGVRFVIVRVSHGDTYDRKWIEHVKGARGAGMVVGLYHFYEAAPKYPNAPGPLPQAELFLEGMRSQGLIDAPGLLPRVLDIEDGHPQPSELVVWLERIWMMTKRCPWVYTNAGWWNQHMGNDTRFAGYPLWASDWTPPLRTPKPWTDAIMWQHTNAWRCPGIEAPVDRNVFNGCLETLLWMVK